jgi:uracil-DNA glycosylase
MPEAAVPDTTSVRRLRATAESCRACDLYRDATQTVFGAGPATARIMLIGEQPVLLGATAAATVLGSGFRVTAQRGRPLPWLEVGHRSPLVDGRSPDLEAVLQNALVVGTVHPSAVLRSRDREAAYAAFVHDLGVVAGLAAAR